ncbi:SET domain-containing protein-lysine N-methyltransferase [Candidatus Jorgensenbacteria bacterium]|nr:SET domain-containing protein-lysine N-methyltransferase [Candidatus Jorgensenbacteria bacterium]
MDIPQESWLNPKIELKESQNRGKGLFAIELIKAGEKILIWGGLYVHKKEAEKAKSEGKFVMQCDEDLYSVEDRRGGDKTYFINHSCEPNAWMGDMFTIVARRDIVPDEEVTIDYAVFGVDSFYVSKWECVCGSMNCRKRITGKDWMLPELQERYRGHFLPVLNRWIAGLHS